MRGYGGQHGRIPAVCRRRRASGMALPNAEIMIHQPLGGVQGQAEDIKIHAEWILKDKRKTEQNTE